MRVYVACPYSHPAEGTREARALAATGYAAHLMQQGDVVFSPLSHSHPIALFGIGGDWATWRDLDEALLAWCDEVHVLCLPGWEASEGVRHEVAQAEALGKAVRWIAEGGAG